MATKKIPKPEPQLQPVGPTPPHGGLVGHDMIVMPDTLSVVIENPRQRIFLAALIACCGNFKMACEVTGYRPQSHYEWNRTDPYRTAYREALRLAGDRLEQEAIRRAVHGIRRLKFNSKTGEPYIDPATGEPYVEHVYSDQLLMMLLKANNEKYADITLTKTEININANQTNNTQTNNVTVQQQAEAFDALRKELAADLLDQPRPPKGESDGANGNGRKS